MSERRPITKVLVANRGEIAVRVIRACRELGIETVAVFSEADREALHVLMADEAYSIGPPEPAESYLNVDRIAQVAKASGADAIHPGYGFLSENPLFAEACLAAGLVFIGPPPAAMRAMSDKTAARRTATELAVPVIPGTATPLANDVDALRIAREIGYPVMIKAAMGGGGKGMRLVQSEKDLTTALRMARSEAGLAFGDASVYVEREIRNPRHVEIQILADAHGGVVHLGERECSIQRRHQKLIEESPSPVVDDELRRRLGEAACRIARAAGYVNAGTVEFLVDSERDWYFLEMNTRLQVEHPVTEMVTGIDVVQEQIRIAAGEPLGYRQADVPLRGAAIECRINAEDPFAGWLPSPGTVTGLRAAEGPGVRHDSGVYEGCTIPPFYDTLVAKLVVWAADRPAAIRRMTRALAEYKLVGVRTTIPVLQHVIGSAEFKAGRLSTAFLDSIMPTLHAEDGRHRTAAQIAAVLTAYERPGRQGGPARETSWGRWRLGVRSGWPGARP